PCPRRPTQGRRTLRARKSVSSTSLCDEPAAEDREDVHLLPGCQGMTLRYPMRLLQAAPAAGAGRMLGDEDRVVPHRWLPPVVPGASGGEPLLDELLAVRHDSLQALSLQVAPLGGTEPEPAAERRACQPVEDSVEIAAHLRSPSRLVPRPQ